LLVRLRQGLQSIRYPDEHITAFLDDLIALHGQALDGPRTTAPPATTAVDLLLDDVAAPATPASAPPGEAAEGFWVAENEASEAGYLSEDAVVPPAPAGVLAHDWSVADLTVGCWVELLLNEEWVRAQLTWASPHRTLFMFTSVKGLAHSMTRRTMDRLRNRGLIRVVSDGHVVDSALDAVAQAALRNEQAGPGHPT
jgi:hypothetical protein